MHQDHRCTPARGRYFPLSFAALLGRIAAFPRFRHCSYPPRRLSLHLRNGRLEARHGHLLCVVRPLGYLMVFSLPDHIVQVHGRRAMDYALERLRIIIPDTCCVTDRRAFGLHYAYLGPLGLVTITRQSSRRHRTGRAHRRHTRSRVMTRGWIDCDDQEILVSTPLPRSRHII